ncbi:MAG: AAA family ATPase [Burkholderiaceae bacterium]
MRSYLAAGERTRALHLFHSFSSRLEDELGIEPGAELQALYRDLPSQPDDSEDAEPSSIRPGISAELRGGSTPLIGREAAQLRLMNVWHEIGRSGMRMVSIQGEAGIGKTALARHAPIAVQDSIATQAFARAFYGEGALPFAPVVSWLRNPVFRQSLLALAPHRSRDLARMAPDLIESASLSPQQDAPDEVSPALRRRHLFEALLSVLSGAPAPMWVTLDDLQWADPDTLEWLRFLFWAAAATPLMLVITIRAENLRGDSEASALLDELERSGQLERIELAGLDLEQTRSLVSKQIDSHTAADEEIVRSLHLRSAGNPLFIRELLRARQAMPASAPSPAEDALPPRLHALIRARFAALDQRTLRIAELAAAYGDAFNVGLLAAASDGDADTVADALDELWWNRLIRGDGEQAYLFAHDCVREAIYESCSPIRRQALHRHLADALRNHVSAPNDQYAGRLARHEELAGRHELALAAYRLAAEASFRRVAYADAFEYLKSAQRLLDTPGAHDGSAEQLAEVLMRQASIRQLLDGFSSAEIASICRRLESLLPEVHSVSVATRLRQRLRIHWADRQVRKAVRIGWQQVRALDDIQDFELRMLAYHDATFSFWIRGRILQAADLYRQANREITTALASGHARADALRHMPLTIMGLWPLAARMVGDGDEFELAMRRFLAMPSKQLSPVARAFVILFRSRLYQISENDDALAASIEKLSDLAEASSHQMARLWCDELRGWLLCRTGDPHRGIAMQQTAIEQMESLLAMFQPLRRLHLAECMLDVGLAQEARKIVSAALDGSRQTASRAWDADLHCLDGRALVMLEAPVAQIERRLHRAIALACAHGNRAAELRARTHRALWKKGRNEANEFEEVAVLCDSRIDPALFRLIRANQ